MPGMMILLRLVIPVLALSLAQGPARAQHLGPEDAPTIGSTVALRLASWVRASGDNQGLPFLVIDKEAAEVFVFDSIGQFRASSPALLGSARGDDSVPGIGDRGLSDIGPGERTTPAGRFIAAFGPAAGREAEFWVDYANAVALHPVVTHNPKEHRLDRLLTPSAGDNRITYGCINVPRSFFDSTIRTTFRGTRGMAYILPETRPLKEVFPAFAAANPIDGEVVGAVAPVRVTTSDAQQPRPGQ